MNCMNDQVNNTGSGEPLVFFTTIHRSNGNFVFYSLCGSRVQSLNLKMTNLQLMWYNISLLLRIHS